MIQLFEDFRSALGFITVLPVGKSVKWSPLGMIKCFPLVGLVLGLLLYAADLVFSLIFSPVVVSVLDTIVLIGLTGAFHLDGLGDAADGLFSHRPKEQVMEIMKDSRIGMMGLVAVVCVLAAKTAGIYGIKSTLADWPLFLTFLVVPAYARSGMIFGIRFLRYGRKHTGTGLDLFERPVKVMDFCFVLIPVLLSVFLGLRGIVVLAVFIAGATGILVFYQKKLNCITGDMLGAMTEVVETLLFLAAGAAVL